MIKGLYERIEGDYEKALSRMSSDDRIKKYLTFFLADESYQQLKNAMENEQVDEAFRAAHTLKGVCQNMAFTALGKVAEEITEELRAKNMENAKKIFPNVERSYKKVIDEINAVI